MIRPDRARLEGSLAMLWTTWKTIAPFIRRPGAVITVMVVLGLISAAGESIALLIAVRLATALGGGDVGDGASVPLLGSMPLGVAVTLALVGAVVSLGVHVLIAIVNARVTAGVLMNTRTEVIGSFIRSSWETQAAEREGSLQETSTGLSQRTSGLVQAYVTAGTNAVMLLVFIVAAMIVSPVATLVVIVVGLVITAGLRPLTRATRRSGAAFSRANSAFAQHVASFSSTSMELKVFGVQTAAQGDVLESAGLATHTQLRARFFSYLGTTLFRDIAILLLVVCISVLALLGNVEAAAVLVIITLVVRALASAQAVNGATQTIRETGSNVLLLAERVAYWRAGSVTHGTRVATGFETLTIEDVSYRYPGTDSGVDDLSLTIQAGEAIGVIGRSGAGKSTFTQLMLRLRQPSTGAIRLDGIDYSEFTDESWTALLGFVPQEPSLLEGTVASNIDFNRGLSREAIEHAAELSHVAADIRGLDGAFDYRLGPRGAGLSGGQKQRVAIARALASSPKLLVLDEPTSALDPRSEGLLIETLDDLKGSTAMVIVAHRLSTVEICDRLIVFEDGRITRVGTPDEILRGQDPSKIFAEDDLGV
jgi:ATP-binding cassette, subfamily B, bacterial